MPDLLWKAVRRDWTSRGGVRWDVGATTRHPTSTAMVRNVASTYLSLSDTPAMTLIGRAWPCRLLRVEPVGEVLDSSMWPWPRWGDVFDPGMWSHRRCALAVRVVAEVEPWRALGPNGRTVAAVIDRCGRLTDDEARGLAAAGAAAGAVARSAVRNAVWDTRSAVRNAAWDAAWDAAEHFARHPARAAARDAACAFTAAGAATRALADAGLACVVRDLITPEQYATLTAPFVSIVGPLDELPVPAWVDEPATGDRHA